MTPIHSFIPSVYTGILSVQSHFRHHSGVSTPSIDSPTASEKPWTVLPGMEGGLVTEAWFVPL